MNVYCSAEAHRMGYGMVTCYLQEGHYGMHHDGAMGIMWMKGRPRGDDGEAGVSEPAGDSPDNPATPEARIPGQGGIEGAAKDLAGVSRCLTR